jgi:hypothetical protein
MPHLGSPERLHQSGIVFAARGDDLLGADVLGQLDGERSRACGEPRSAPRSRQCARQRTATSTKDENGLALGEVALIHQAAEASNADGGQRGGLGEAACEGTRPAAASR